MNAPFVSFVVANWNGRHHLESCLPSLAALGYPHDRREVIVVDNASEDDSVRWLRREWPDVRILENAHNVGFAPASNRGAEEAHGSLIAFVNNDVRLDPSWLRRLVDGVGETGAAAAASTLLDWDGRRYDFAGASMNFYGHGASRRHGLAFDGSTDGTASTGRARDTLFPCGGAMVADRARFLACGGFDPDYFAYFEDVDLGWRLWVHGERVVHVPQAIAYHRHHGSGMNDDRRVGLLERNALASVVKNYDDDHLQRVLPAAWLLLEARARAAAGCRAETYRATVAELLDGLPALLAKRAAVQARRRRTDEEILPLFGEPFRPSLFGAAYWREQQRVVGAFGITAMFGDGDGAAAGMDDFIAELQGRIEDLERQLDEERRACTTAEAERGSAEARLQAEIARLRDEIASRRTPALKRLWQGVRAWMG